MITYYELIIAQKYMGSNVVGQAAGMMGMGGHGSSHGGAGPPNYGAGAGGGAYAPGSNTGGMYD